MKRKVISLFSGAGGMDIGFEEAGFRTVVAVEADKSCCETLRTNKPNLSIINQDITTVTTKEILLAGGLEPLEAALVIGGPPCQSFSLAGKRLGMDDKRGKLVLEFIRIVREALPVAFVMENVRGMANWSGGKAIEAILNEAHRDIHFNEKTYNYKITYKILNAVDYGASQFRERIFIVGNRIGRDFTFPKPNFVSPSTAQADLFGKKQSAWRTVWDAIGHLPPADSPSGMALRVAETIKGRREKHGY